MSVDFENGKHFACQTKSIEMEYTANAESLACDMVQQKEKLPAH